MRRFLLSFVLLVSAGYAQPANPPKGELLWPGGAPGAQGTEDIDKPTLVADRAGLDGGPALIARVVDPEAHDRFGVVLAGERPPAG